MSNGAVQLAKKGTDRQAAAFACGFQRPKPVTVVVRTISGILWPECFGPTGIGLGSAVVGMMWVEWLRDAWAGIHAGQFPDLGAWSYILLALLVATEGPLSTLLGATAAAAGILDVRLVFLAAVVGNISGDLFWYALGYSGRIESLLSQSRRLESRRRHIDRLKREMHTHAAKLIIFAKLAYGLIVPTLVAAGMARVPWRRWFPVVFVMETLWSLMLVWLGFHATAMIVRIEQELQLIGAVVLALGAGVGFWWVRRRIDRKEIEMDPLIQPSADPVSVVDDSGWTALLAAHEPGGDLYETTSVDHTPSGSHGIGRAGSIVRRSPDGYEPDDADGFVEPPVRGRTSRGVGA